MGKNIKESLKIISVEVSFCANIFWRLILKSVVSHLWTYDQVSYKKSCWARGHLTVEEQVNIERPILQ